MYKVINMTFLNNILVRGSLMSSVTISHRLDIYKNPSLILFKSQKRFSILRWENVAFGEFLKTD